MIPGRVAVELVVQTATSLVAHRLAPREAVTILASQSPQAMGAAPALAGADPERARTYAALLTSLAGDLGAQLAACDDPADLRAVVEDLGRVAAALAEG